MTTPLSDIFQSLNEQGQILKVSQAWLEFSGYTEEEVLGSHFINFLNPTSHQCAYENFPKLKKYGHLDDIKLSFQHKSGTYIDVILKGTSHYDEDGNFTHTYCEVKTLEQLIKSKEEVEALLEKTQSLNEELLRTKNELLEEKRLFAMSEQIANIGYWKTSYTNEVHVWSDELYRIFGHTPQKTVASYSAYLSTVHPEDKKRVHKAFMDLVKKAIPLNITHRGIKKDGSIFHIRNHGQAFKDKKGEMLVLVGTVFDVTQEIQMQEKLAFEKEKAEKASETKAQFLANMSHEIRTPMNAILGFVDILSKQENDLKKKEQFDIISSSGKALLHIINDILDFSKIQSKKLLIEEIPFNPQETFKNSIMLYSGLADEKKINFNYTISDTLPNYCLGDEIRLKQVVSNLISNAIKFTPEGGYIQVNVNYTQDRVYLSVEDSGVGIHHDKLEHIFNMFEQEDSSVTRSYGGTGLGLAISKELVEMMGGELLVRSHVGFGSHFNFNIILKTIAKEDEPSIEDTKESNQALKGRVLVVEDNKSNQLLMSIFLEELGLDFDIANDGQEGVQMLKECTYEQKLYQAILMDENMPNMNGIQACKEIRAFEKDKPHKSLIIAVTANALHNDKERFLDAGMDDYLSKPVNQKDLEEMLRKYL